MYRRPYVESSVFIAFIRAEMKGDDHNCKAIFDSILDAAKEGGFSIYTSALTIAEVFKNKKKGVQLTEQENEDLCPYFREGYIRIIEVDRAIGERANELCRTHVAAPNRPALRPNDAIHLACAERANCDVLLAYDPDLSKQTHDAMSIEWPSAIVAAMQQSPAAAPVADQAELPLQQG
jgi:predicted nucleic acid-binding protein